MGAYSGLIVRRQPFRSGCPPHLFDRNRSDKAMNNKYIIHIPFQQILRPCYLYIFKQIEEDGETNSKIGITYRPDRRVDECSRAYGRLFFHHSTYECTRRTAYKIESSVKDFFKNKTIGTTQEFFSVAPNIVEEFVRHRIKELGGSYAHSHDTA